VNYQILIANGDSQKLVAALGKICSEFILTVLLLVMPIGQ